jgi:hypothetical protein
MMGQALDLQEIYTTLQDAFLPCHFLVGQDSQWEWDPGISEVLVWEIYRGRLLDAAATRQESQFRSWNLYKVQNGKRSVEPVLSVKVAHETRLLHVTRGIFIYVWEGYDAGSKVFLSRESPKWARELVGSIDLARCSNVMELRDELIRLLFHAIVGTSRLPLNSLEAPLPDFSFGQLTYCYRTRVDSGQAAGNPVEAGPNVVGTFLHRELNPLELVKLLEFLLRATPQDHLPQLANSFGKRWSELFPQESLLALLRGLFNQVSLTPWTDFVPRALGFLTALELCEFLSSAAHIDFLCWLVRHVGRHLTAYDLKVFHHRGANYPDALLLEALLRSLLKSAEQQPKFFQGLTEEAVELRSTLLRRRALRQGWLLRRFYEGLLVPESPTSMGENVRILPLPHVRVPVEQIEDPTKRPRKLFHGNPLPLPNEGALGAIARQCIEDLRDQAELRELGMALFIDRPFSHAKTPGEPDTSLILSYEAFIPSLALERLNFLRKEAAWCLGGQDWEALAERLKKLPVEGIPLEQQSRLTLPGIASLTDALRVAPDIILVRTTANTLADFLSSWEWFGVEPIRERIVKGLGKSALILMRPGSPAGPLNFEIYDGRYRRRVELRIHVERESGLASPEAGMEIVRIWEENSPHGVLIEKAIGKVLCPVQGRRFRHSDSI